MLKKKNRVDEKYHLFRQKYAPMAINKNKNIVFHNVVMMCCGKTKEKPVYVWKNSVNEKGKIAKKKNEEGNIVWKRRKGK